MAQGHKYLTLVYQIQEGVQTAVVGRRSETGQTLHGFFDLLGASRAPPCSSSVATCGSRTWRLSPRTRRGRRSTSPWSRYHVMAKMNKAIDEVRAAEAKRLKADGYEPVLKHSRWVLLKRPENLTEQQAVKLKELRGIT